MPFQVESSSSTAAVVPQLNHVLVVEDQDRQALKMLDALQMLDIPATRARTAHEAIRIAATERPAVILMDGLLPGMHGFEVARFIRHIDSTYRPYIVMTTAIYKNVKYINDALLRYDIDDYVVKPVSVEKVADIVANAHAAQLGQKVSA